jgi:hypothetical protein
VHKKERKSYIQTGGGVGKIPWADKFHIIQWEQLA